MSNNESFIDEVNEEVSRDKLFGVLRRYGWIGIVGVVALVGGASWNEWSKAQSRSAAQDLGSSLMAALEISDGAERVASLEAVNAEGTAGYVADMLRASQALEIGDREAAIAALQGVSDASDAPQIYRQIALFKTLLIQAPDMNPDDRRDAFAGLAVPGQPLRMLALEQVALADVAAGDRDAAIAGLQAMLQDAEMGQAGRSMRDRVQTMLAALGGDVPEDVIAQ